MTRHENLVAAHLSGVKADGGDPQPSADVFHDFARPNFPYQVEWTGEPNVTDKVAAKDFAGQIFDAGLFNLGFTVGAFPLGYWVEAGQHVKYDVDGYMEDVAGRLSAARESVEDARPGDSMPGGSGGGGHGGDSGGEDAGPSRPGHGHPYLPMMPPQAPSPPGTPGAGVSARANADPEYAAYLDTLRHIATRSMDAASEQHQEMQGAKLTRYTIGEVGDGNDAAPEQLQRHFIHSDNQARIRGETLLRHEDGWFDFWSHRRGDELDHDYRVKALDRGYVLHSSDDSENDED